jgi:hypothetical protein
MVRAFAQRNLQHNNDVAIITMDPMPQHQVPFTEIRDDIVQFLAKHKHIPFRSVQPCHLGQAYVQFNSCLDHDALVSGSPHHWLGQNFTFDNHDASRNRRAMEFNHDCWLLMLGFPLDYWNNENLEAAISSYGRLLIWERDDRYLERLIIKAKVTSLHDVTSFIVVTDGDAFYGES